jgi:hypothetical protein
MTCILDTAKWEAGYIQQILNMNDDSMSFLDDETGETLFKVDSSGYLTNGAGDDIGEFCLGDKQWTLKIDGEVFAEGPQNGLFKLPEFELVAIVKLLNSMNK